MKFRATILLAKKTATGICVPVKIIESLDSGKKPAVIVTIGNYSYRSTVAVMGGEFMIPLSADHRIAAGVEAGYEVDVVLELDTEPRTVELPEDLKMALMGKSEALETFEALAFTKRKEFVRHVNDAKTPDTRSRRISGIVSGFS